MAKLVIKAERTLTANVESGCKLLLEPHDGWVTWYKKDHFGLIIYSCQIDDFESQKNLLLTTLWPEEILALAKIVKREMKDAK